MGSEDVREVHPENGVYIQEVLAEGPGTLRLTGEA